jgi:hypothetical protein
MRNLIVSEFVSPDGVAGRCNGAPWGEEGYEQVFDSGVAVHTYHPARGR